MWAARRMSGLPPGSTSPSPKGVSPKPSVKTVLHSLGRRHEIDKRRFLWDLRVALAWTASIWAPAAKHHGLNLSRLQHLQSWRRQFFNLLDRSSSSLPGSKFPVRQIHDSPVDLSRCPTNHACTLSLIPGRSSSRAKHPPIPVLCAAIFSHLTPSNMPTRYPCRAQPPRKLVGGCLDLVSFSFTIGSESRPFVPGVVSISRSKGFVVCRNSCHLYLFCLISLSK